MLGRQRKTTRLDVGLALAFAGVGYVIWALVAGTTRALVSNLGVLPQMAGVELPTATRIVQAIFFDLGVALDVAGLAWLAVSLLLVVLSGRQFFSISWAWASAMGQSLVAGLGGAWVAWAVHLPYQVLIKDLDPNLYVPTPLQQVSGFSLPAAFGLALVVWMAFLGWLLAERRGYMRRAISHRDGMRRHV